MSVYLIFDVDSRGFFAIRILQFIFAIFVIRISLGTKVWYNLSVSNEPGEGGQGGNCPCLHEGNFGVGRLHRAKPVNEGNVSFTSAAAEREPGEGDERT